MRLPLATKRGQGRSIPLSAERLINMYAEKAPDSAKSPVVVHGCPGYQVFSESSSETIDNTPSPNTIYMTRFADGTNADIGPNETVPDEFGTGHNYASGYYDLNIAHGTSDYMSIDLSSFFTAGEPVVIEALVEYESSASFSIMPFLSLLFNGDNKEWGFEGSDGTIKYDTDLLGDQYVSPSPTSGAFHVAVQIEHSSDDTYEIRAYYDGAEVYTGTDVSPLGWTEAKIGGYLTNGPQVFKIHEVAVRKELKYTGPYTVPSTLDNP